ncbi:MAG TPA: glycosyltransferase [Thermoanaerobaculia bacterium]|nr:glycosyltransferase [Thermoanaerobaculia bacterium]
MSTIAFLLDVEEGHFLSTFGLAHGLRTRGHSVCYLGLGGAEALVRQQGFDFIPIFSETLSGTRMTDIEVSGPFGTTRALVEGWLDGAFGRLRPDAVIQLSLFSLEAAIVERRYGLPVVLLTPQYRSDVRAVALERQIRNRFSRMRPQLAQKVLATLAGEDRRARSFADLARLLLSMPDLVLLPREFDLPELAADPHVTYIGAGVDLARAEEPFPWEALDPRLPLVYCSLGSQADLASHPDRPRRFFHCVIEAAAARPDLQIVLSVGRGFAPSELPVRSPNLYVAGWIPQMTVLGRASLMVSHAGIGTIKECILKGVPLVVLPLMRDQFESARRVVHHGLGLEGGLEDLTPAGLLALIDAVAGDPAFRRRVGAMRDRFLESNDASLGASVVEAEIARRAATCNAPRTG